MPKLEIRNVSKNYGTFTALKNVSFTLTPGVYGLLGPNGAGKTTLIKTIVGAHKSSEGDIYYNDKVIDIDFLEHLGFLPQAPSLYPNYTAEEFLMYVCIIKGLRKGDRKSEIDRLLKLVNLQDEKKKIHTYSGGMKQRLGIAQALINDPDVLIFDEPTAGLDPRERLRFRNVISQLSLSKIVILATHIVSDIENIAKEIILLKDGILLGSYSPKVLIDNISPYVWGIDSISVLEYQKIDSSYHVSNVKVEDSFVTLRVISQEKPHEKAYPLKANLEDVYLYTFEYNQ